MAINCFNCNEGLESHDSEKTIACLTALSKKMESIQKNLQDQQTLLRVPNDDEALEHFTKTKTGEPSRMGSN
jgi:hypothetical protein